MAHVSFVLILLPVCLTPPVLVAPLDSETRVSDRVRLCTEVPAAVLIPLQNGRQSSRRALRARAGESMAAVQMGAV
jgi:hypothetical protein